MGGEGGVSGLIANALVCVCAVCLRIESHCVPTCTEIGLSGWEPRLAVGKGGSLVAEDTSSGNTLPLVCTHKSLSHGQC